jgi:hypothetical protein
MKAALGIVLLGFVIVLAGCFRIMDIEGLKLAYQDKFLAEAKGVQLKNLNDVSEDQKLQAANEYRQTEAAVNAYFQQVITDAAVYRVNEPADSYQKAPAHDQVEAFVNQVDGLQAQKKTAVLSIATGADLAVIMLNEIFTLQGQRQKEAYDRFVNTVKENLMKDYEALPATSPEK